MTEETTVTGPDPGQTVWAVVHRTATGDVLRTAVTTARDRWHLAADGCTVTTLHDAPAIPPPPNDAAQLRYVNGAFVWHDPRTLEQIRAGRLAALRDERDAVITGGFVCDGSRFDSDSTSQQRLLGALVAAQAGAITEVSWRLYDNSWRLLSGAEIAAVYQALTAHTQSAFTTFKALEAAVLAATTAEGVEAVQWPST